MSGKFKYSSSEYSFNETFAIRCFVPTNRTAPPFEHQLIVSKNKQRDAQLAYPACVPVDSTLFIQGKPKLAWNVSIELSSFPLNCWVSTVINGAVQKRHFIESGCLVSDSDGYGLSRIHFFQNESPKIAIDVKKQLFPEDNSNSKQEFQIGCEFMTCTFHSVTGLLNVLKCPGSQYCVSKHFRDTLFHYQSTSSVMYRSSVGPVLITSPESLPAPPADTFPFAASPKHERVFNCSTQCSSPPNDLLKNGTVNVFVKGISFSTAMAYVFASFFTGVVVMSLTWWSCAKRTVPVIRDHRTQVKVCTELDL